MPTPLKTNHTSAKRYNEDEDDHTVCFSIIVHFSAKTNEETFEEQTISINKT
jgi:hypothetical protein